MESPLKLARLRRGWTQEQLAAACGVNAANMSRIERGLQIPSRSTAAAIAVLLAGEIDEMQLLYPERYVKGPKGRARQGARG